MFYPIACNHLILVINEFNFRENDRSKIKSSN